MPDQHIRRQKAPFKAKKKVFNLVYFQDAAKTKSLKMPVAVARLLIATLLLGVVWCVGSFFVIGYLADRVSSLKEELVESNQVIFDYQVRFDGVYEAAYSNDKSNSLYALLSSSTSGANENKAGAVSGKGLDSVVTKQSDISTEADDPSSQKDKQANTKKQATGSQPVSLAASSLSSAESAQAKNENSSSNLVVSTDSTLNYADPTQENDGDLQPLDHDAVSDSFVDVAEDGNPVTPPLAIKNISLKANKNSLVLSFLLKNNSRDKLSGFVWAVAAIEEDQQTAYVTAPESIQLNDFGEVIKPPRSSVFSVRNFSNKKFSFPIDEKDRDRLSRVKIGLMDQDGKIRNINIPLKRQI